MTVSYNDDSDTPAKLEITASMEAYAIYDKIISAVSVVDMISTPQLEALDMMLQNYKPMGDLDLKVVQSMREYVRAELVSDKLRQAAKI